MYKNTLTTDISKMDLSEVTPMLTAYQEDNTTPAFRAMWCYDGTIPTLNQESGYCFLTNEEFQAAMIEPSTGKLSMFISCPECGREDLERDWIWTYKSDSKHDYDSTKCEGCKEVRKMLKECEE
tara:strand:- start:555 stop:926 length:372 start_codon:yes stop_codon:yes gene_type:complete